MKFEGNFGELILNINGKEATGTYQANGTLKGVFINNTFKGQWENKGMEGLVEFTITDDKLEGNWKKGLDPGPMKGIWEGVQILEETKSSFELNSLKQIPLEINEITESLKNNFLFQVSLGSKELFHSNLIAWLLEQKNKNGEYEALIIFLDILNYKINLTSLKDNDVIISREENNIDVVIKWKEDDEYNYIFIENKMKSIPTEEQLKGYNVKIEKYIKNEKLFNNKFLLTPFGSTIGEVANWKNITYQREVLNFLSLAINIDYSNKNIKLIIEKYIEFINDVLSLLNVYLGSTLDGFKNKKYNFYTHNLSYLKKIRLHDLMLKNMHERLGFLLNEKLNDSYIEIKTNFTRGTGITDIFYDLIGTDFKIGMQIQGNSLKHCMFSKNHKNNLKNIEYCKKIIRNKLWFYDFTKNPYEILSGKGQNPSLKIEDTNEILCEYSNGHFLYLSKSLDEFALKSIDSLIDYIFNEYRYLIKNKDNILEIVK